MEWNRCPAELSLPSYPPRCQPWEWSHFRSSRSDQPEKAMAPHSSTLAWKILWMEEPGRLQSMGSLSRTRLSDFTFTFRFHALEKEMATHSSVLAWRIPGMGGAWWAAVYGVTQSRTRLKWLSNKIRPAVHQMLPAVPSQCCVQRNHPQEHSPNPWPTVEVDRQHHWVNEHEFKQTLGDNEGPGSLACCSPWGQKELDTT